MDKLALLKITHSGNALPIGLWEAFENFQKSLFSWPVATEIDLGVPAQIVFGLIWHLGAAEDNQNVGIGLFEGFCQDQRAPLIPDIETKAHHLGLGKLGQCRLDIQTVVNQGQKPVTLWVWRFGLDIGL